MKVNGRAFKWRHYDRLYYRYQNLEEVLNMFNKKKIISGFTIRDFPNSIFVAYGSIGPTFNYVEVSLLEFGDAKKSCGLTYGKCKIRQDFLNEGEERKEVESEMERYCLLLPFTQEYVSDSDFERYYAIVYDDWTAQLRAGNDGIGLPNICERLNNVNVLA